MEGLLVGQLGVGVLQLQLGCQLPGLLGLVVGTVETDGEGVVGPHHRRYVTGVHPGGQEGTNLDSLVGEGVGLDGVGNNVFDVVDGLVEGLILWVEVGVPVFLHAELAILVVEAVALRQLVDSLEEGLLGSRVLEGHVRLQGLLVQLLIKVRVVQEGLDLGPHEEGSVHLTVVERLDPKVVPGPEHLLVLEVPDDEGKHPPQALQDVITPFLVTVQDNLGIRVG